MATSGPWRRRSARRRHARRGALRRSTSQDAGPHSPSGDHVVTVTDGPHEPHSLGSYALRLYKPLDPAWPYDSFVAGLIRPRDGTVADLILVDDEQAAILVVVKSAGSGGYLSVDGFRATDSRLIPSGHVSGLPPDADPAVAIRDARPESPCPDHYESHEVARWPHPTESLVSVLCREDPTPGWSENFWVLDWERGARIPFYGRGVDSFAWLDCDGEVLAHLVTSTHMGTRSDRILSATEDGMVRVVDDILIPPDGGGRTNPPCPARRWSADIGLTVLVPRVR